MSRVSRVYPTDQVTLREVALRDGLQLVKSFPSTEAKREWIEREYAAGVRHFEVGSFLPVNTMPQFADVREMIQTVGKYEGAFSAALALNERGANDALMTNVDEILCVVSATEEHSQANMRRSRAEAIELAGKVVRLSKNAETKPLVTVALSMSFGCSISGAVEPAEVLRLAEACLKAGVDVIAVADTVGYTGPKHVGELCAEMIKLCGNTPVVAHLHDTRGMAIANASAALDAGVRIFDGSLGGLGGCQFAPGATGNVVFEDLVYLCESKGFRTGIDIEALSAVRTIAQHEMPDEKLYGSVARAGMPKSDQWRG